MTKFIKFTSSDTNKTHVANVSRIRTYFSSEGGTILRIGDQNHRVKESPEYFNNLLDFVGEENDD